jgi:hypothetical protein
VRVVNAAFTGAFRRASILAAVTSASASPRFEKCLCIASSLPKQPWKNQAAQDSQPAEHFQRPLHIFIADLAEILKRLGQETASEQCSVRSAPCVYAKARPATESVSRITAALSRKRVPLEETFSDHRYRL